jgi:hypothetical protein
MTLTTVNERADCGLGVWDRITTGARFRGRGLPQDHVLASFFFFNLCVFLSLCVCLSLSLCVCVCVCVLLLLWETI